MINERFRRHEGDDQLDLFPADDEHAASRKSFYLALAVVLIVAGALFAL